MLQDSVHLNVSLTGEKADGIKLTVLHMLPLGQKRYKEEPRVRQERKEAAKITGLIKRRKEWLRKCTSMDVTKNRPRNAIWLLEQEKVIHEPLMGCEYNL